MSASGDPLTRWRKARLAARAWSSLLRVQWLLRRGPLPTAVRRLADDGDAWWPPLRPMRMSRIVDRSLRVGRWRPRCLLGALVLFRLLRAQGADAELVIGLPEHAGDHEAHAWVEIEGVDVGPPPGKGRHQELARYR